MKTRAYLLLLLLIVSILTGLLFWFFTDKDRQIRLADNVYKTYQKDAKCVVESGGYYAVFKESCSVFRADDMAIIGSVDNDLISYFKLKKELKEAQYITFQKLDVSRNLFDSLLLFFKNFRNYCLSLYARYLPQDVAGLIAGIVLGSKEFIRYDFYQEMIKSGTVHIAVASGFNLMLLYGQLSIWLYWLFDRKKVFAVLALILFFYAMMAGMEPPVIRAWLMLVILLGSNLVGREVPGWWVLFLSVWAMLVWDWKLIGNISFQLSVMSSFALIVILPWLKQLSFEKGLGNEFAFLEKKEVITTFLATLFTAPIIYWHFGRVSWWGVLSNILVLPLVPILMVAGMLMVVFPGIFYFPVYLLGKLVVVLIHFFGN